MRFYNAAIYNRRDDTVPNTVIEVNSEGCITDIFQDAMYTPEEGDVDCQGFVAFPSFMDCAVTLPGSAIYNDYGLSLSRYNTVDEYIYAVESFKGNRLRAFGYNTFTISSEGTERFKGILDRKWPYSPAYILADDLTTVIVNEYILDISKEFFSIDKELHETGELDCYQLAKLRCCTDLFDFNTTELTQGLLSFQYTMLKNGITTVRVLDTLCGWDVIQAVERLYRAGAWFVTTVFTVPIFPFETEEEMWKKYERYLSMTNEKMSVTGVTLMLDGSIDSAQAALIAPYEIDSNWYGDVLWSMRKLNKVVSMFVEAGIDVNIRAFGDKAVSVATFALTGMRVDYKSGARSITHAYLMSDMDISTCSREGITVCVEPNSVPYNNTFYEGDELMLGERCYDQYPVGRVMYGGINTIAGSNFPTQQDINPIHGVYKATHRVSTDDVNIWRVLSAYGETAYKRFGLWGTRGSITPGKKADFVLLNKDIIHMNDSLLMDVSIMVTVVDGKVVSTRDGGL